MKKYDKRSKYPAELLCKHTRRLRSIEIANGGEVAVEFETCKDCKAILSIVSASRIKK